jgi:hypothetical protein
MISYMKYINKNIDVSTLLFLAFILMCAFLSVITIDQAQAETGKGVDVFNVIMTIFGVDKSKGNMVAIVTVNNGEVSKVKFLDAEAPYVVPTANPNTPGAEGGLIDMLQHSQMYGKYRS